MLGRRAIVLFVLAGCRFAADAAPDAATTAPHADAPRASDGAVIHHDDAPPDAAPPEVRFVQGSGTVNGNWNNGGGDLALALPAAVGSGDAIAVFISWADTGSLDSVTDSLGNTFAVVDTVDDGDQQQEGATAYAQDVVGGSDTITAHFSNSPCCRIVVAHEARGASTTAALAGHAGQLQSGPGTGSDAVTSSAGSAGPGDYVFGVTTNTAGTSGQTITAGTDETMRELMIPSGEGNPTASEDCEVSGGSSAASTFTYGKDARGITLELVLQP
jgi:hypothetical protein